VPPSVAALLCRDWPGNVLAMVQHQGNCLRRWSQLAQVVKTGKPATRTASIRGEAADYASFIEAMDNISAPMAGKIVADLQPLRFKHLLDVGGASGSWTIAFLNANASATATIFDLPQVMPQAQARIGAAGLQNRVTLVGGNYESDALPAGADLAWISAIVHSNSREANRRLFAATHKALVANGLVLVRDIIMDESRTSPPSGALFAVNMLTGTAQGGTFTFDELREDLESAGFVGVDLVRKDPWMNNVLLARKKG
jgi:hypothetical protein